MAKKVFVSAMVLVASCLTAWGQTGYNVTYTNENDQYSFQNMATITKSENSTKTLVEAITEVNEKKINNAAIKKVKIVGDITSSDASALSAITCTTIDLSEATFTSFTNNNVKYVVLPNGWTKEQVNTTAKAIGSSLESAASALNMIVNMPVRHYYEGEIEFTDTSNVKIDSEGNYYYVKTISKDATVTAVKGYPKTKYAYTYGNVEYEIDESKVNIADDGTATIKSFSIPLTQETEWYKQDGITKLESWAVHDKNGEEGKWYWDNNMEYKAIQKPVYTYTFDWKEKTYEGEVTTNPDGTYSGTITLDSEQQVKKTTLYRYEYDDIDGNKQYFDQENEYTESTMTIYKNVDTELKYKYIKEDVNKGVSLTAYVQNPGSLVYTIINMSQLKSEYKNYLNVWYVAGEDYKYDYTAMNVKKITLSGNLNAIDLNNGYYITSDEGRLLNYGSGNGALKYCTTPDILDLSDAIFGEGADYHPEDMTISKLFPTLKSVLLPTHESQKVIPADCFYNMKGITDVMIPSHYEVIGERAFKGCENLTDPKFPSTLKEILSEAYSGALNIKNIKFNDNLEFIGNCAFYCNSAVKECQKTITFPSSLKYMGPGAFYGRRFEDIYFNSVTAPISPIGQISSDKQFYMSAFEDAMHMGNNGFDPLKSENNPNADMANKGFANRENYKNNGGVYFTMLHFPKIEETEIGKVNAETYTDITRKYDTTNPFDSDAQLKVGNEEKTYEFDNGQKWSNYCAPGIVNPGYIDTYRGEQYIWPSQSQWMRSFVCNSLGYKWDGVTEYRPQLTEQQIALMIKDGLTIKNGGTITESNKDKYSDELSMTAYMGTRQFVLANGDHEASSEYPIDVKGGQWWTICVPFNMTKKQIDEVFGEGTHVCLFSDVERHAEGSQKNITLKFVHDVYAHKTVKGADGKYAQYFNDNAPACGDDDIVIYAHESYMIYPTKTDNDAGFVVNNYEPIEGSPLPTIVTASDDTEYRFIGNYTTKIGGDETRKAIARIKTVTIPQYSYMYAQKKGDTVAKFWFYSGTTMAWKANKCVVQATAKDGGTTDFNNFFGDTTSQAKQVSIFGSDDLDDKPTEIEHVEIIAGEQPTNNIKYDLYGRRVADDYKGIYIMNGKKYINR